MIDEDGALGGCGSGLILNETAVSLEMFKMVTVEDGRRTK